MRWWRRWHEGRAWRRRGVKALVFLGVLLLTLYPKPWLIPTWLSRITHMDSVLEPGHPGLADLELQVRRALPAEATPQMALDAVQRAVLKRIPYAWDWEVWGVVEYLPTVGETLAAGREDCDGRAVVAASLLRRMGYEAWLVSDILHVWVETPYGETMGPTGGAKTLSGRGAPGEKTRVHLTLGLARNLARGSAYGVAAFPLIRELIVLAALVAVTLHPRVTAVRLVVALVLLGAALALVRAGGISAAMTGESLWITALGFVAAIVGWCALLGPKRARPGVEATGLSEPRP